MGDQKVPAVCLTAGEPGKMGDQKVPAISLTAGEPDEQMPSGDSEASLYSILCSGTNHYFINEVCSEGPFGKVVNAVHTNTLQEVSLKILMHGAQRELRMLEAVSALDPAKNNVVHFREQFQNHQQTCLVFERLDMNLYQLLQQRRGHPLTLNEIRPIAHQLLTALGALKSIGVVHADLKPDNVMLVNHEAEPFRVKLVGFGRSFMTSEDTLGRKTFTQGYSSPEVILGLPLSEAIDMWGLGCVLLYLYLAYHPFAVNCRYQGTPSEFEHGTGIKAKERAGDIRSLDDLITVHPLLNGANELKDRKEFVSLLKGLLQIDPKKRLTPQRGLSHPFLALTHMMDDMECPYLMNCLDKMGVLDLDDEEP